MFKSMLKIQSENLSQISFAVTKKVEYGQAVYVAGNIQQLGSWEVAKAIRLSWNLLNNEHVWTVCVPLQENKTQYTICYKYFIGDWNLLESTTVFWQNGKHNRSIQIRQNKQNYTCQNTWNMQKINIFLVLDQGQASLGTQYYVIGSNFQLGNWRQPRKMKYIRQQFMFDQRQSQYDNRVKANYSFNVQRSLNKFHYNFIKKSHQYIIERHPGRKYNLFQGNKTHTRCFSITHKSGGTQIYEQCNFMQLVYSKVTPRIYLGAYLQSTEDIELLKKQNVNCVLSIQTQSDFASHSLTSTYMKHICQKNQIQFHTYSIEDMNRKEFVSKSQGALKIMHMLMKNQNNRIYVHCSAGVYRSSQLIVLYLTISENYQLEEAIQFVKQRHPVARPNQKIIQDALLEMSPKLRNKRLAKFKHKNTT